MKWFGMDSRPSTVSKVEARELQAFARQIKRLDLPTLDKETKLRIAAEIGFVHHPYRKTFARSWEGAIAVVVVMVLVFAQSARPGSALYAVKRGTDKVRTAVTHNVPLLNRFDDSAGHDDNSGKSGTTTDDVNRGSSNDDSKTDDSIKNSRGDASGSTVTSSGTEHISAQGSSGSGTAISGSSGDSSGTGSRSDGGSPNSGKDQSTIKVEEPIQSKLD